MLARIVRHDGYAAICAASGAEAIQALVGEGRVVDAIVTDVRMPKMSGIELVSKLLAAGVDVPVLFISGQLDAPMPSTWPRTAPRHFLPKPFTPLQLSAAIAELFSEKHAMEPLLLN
jgi:FixJ family two-component response regulator